MAGYRVLVVEDNPQVRRMVSASIKTLGSEIDVVDVPSAEEALFISASLPIDLVVLDHRLPGMSGLEMVSRFQKRRPEAKIILVTGVEDKSTRQQVAEAGAEAFFYKPIVIDVFLATVKRCLWPERGEQNPILINQEPSVTKPEVDVPTTDQASKSTPQHFKLSLDERLTMLKQQVKAISTILVDNEGKVIEVAGNPSLITSSSVLLSAVLSAYKAGSQVTQAISGGTGASMQYFASLQQCLYIVNVGQSHALLVLTSGYFDPERLSTINQALQTAACDLESILSDQAAEERARLEQAERQRIELPKDVHVDQETLAGVEKLFARGAENSAKEKADSFWESLEAGEGAEGLQGKDVLSYDQARDLGLAPNEEKEPES
jgi:DNA-binding response OmpR family regulator